ncbi:hypothetical protein ONZ51_g3492 [Trametes cubensis]|uniref:Uncharacterized protein n=1 Tax=Trametes cubensis TaxID=1111947 RepID=A0AAD7XDF8_9APHY|nr:hypothetical protein ONZ51_g3492 [Trametes cubensis]
MYVPSSRDVADDRRLTAAALATVVLYKRLILGEPRRRLPTDLERHGNEKVATILTTGEGKGEQGGRPAGV